MTRTAVNKLQHCYYDLGYFSECGVVVFENSICFLAINVEDLFQFSIIGKYLTEHGHAYQLR